MTRTDNFRYGQFYGYSECCIKAFSDVAVPVVFRPDVVRKHIFNGFVPCGSCATKMELGTLTRQQLIDDINTRRECTVPFKEQHTYEENRQIDDESWVIL